MALAPRTPVIVGVGQVTSRPDPDLPISERPEPIELMADALRVAAEDCSGSAPGGLSPAGRHLLERASSLRVVSCLSWRSINPALLVAERLGIEVPELVLSAIGGNMPQSLLHDGAGAIARGEADVVLVTGAESMYTRSAVRRQPDHPALNWAGQPVDGTPVPVPFGTDRTPVTDLELSRGIQLPIHAYPLMENARRASHGWSLDEHRAVIGRLWSAFSEVATGNPYAWLPESRGAEEIMTASPENRMVSFPYPKLCNANLQVDQGAGYILCSVEAAQAAGVPEDRWVFPLSGADAHDHWFLSHRLDLGTSPAIRLAGERALSLAGIGIDEVGQIDLYSCFPVVVQMAAEAFGLPIDDPGRPLTLTGGLTFAGGPGNNYTSHGIAAVVGALRRDPGAIGLATGLGWYATKHAVGLYSSRPPRHEGRDGFRWADVQEEVDALPQCRVDSSATGAVTVETYTVTYGREGEPELGIMACRTEAGDRAWANVNDADELASLVEAEGCGRTGTLDESGQLRLD